jgi:hypothetical protein
MKNAICLVLLFAALAGGGCKKIEPAPDTRPFAAVSVRNNAFSLLHQLLNEQKDVSKILIIKRESRELNLLIKEIAAASGRGAKQLEDFARQDASLALNAIGLPAGELATRDAIANTRKKELLGRSGIEFERSLLLTEIEALSYATHLAQVAAVNDSNPARTSSLTTLSKTMKDFHSRAVQLLRVGS